MNIKRLITSGMLAAGVALTFSAASSGASQLTNTYVQSFDSSSSTAGWWYWYGQISDNSQVAWDGTMDAGGSTPGSGSMHVTIPFTGTGQQQAIPGSFDDEYGYDFSETANGLLFSNISFDIHVNPTTMPDPNGNFGTINVGFYNTGTFASVTIPGAASNGWVKLTVPMNYTVSGIDNIAAFMFDINNYYPPYPTTTMDFWLDNVSLNLNAGPPPPPPTVQAPYAAISGLNNIITSPASSGDRYQIADTNDGAGGLSFVGQSSVTYSWTLKSFPTTDPGYSFQSHFFIVSGSDTTNTPGQYVYPNQYDQAADYNMANCIFVETQPDGNGGAIMSFRYKTNEIGNSGNGNGMIFNAVSPTNTAGNPFGWPVEPIATLDSAQALGTWTLTFANNTNITMTSPSGGSTNFVMDAASAALFHDPCTLLLGDQPNGTNFGGQDVVYSAFSLSGTPAAFTDNFLTDTTLNTNYWEVLANDPNGVVLVPPGGGYWVPWTLPAAGFSLYEASTLPVPKGQWKAVSPVTTIKNGAFTQDLIAATNLPSPTAGYFSMISNSLSQLLVLFPGQTFTPGVSPGYSGTPTPVSGSSCGAYVPEQVTVIALDAGFNLVSSTDSVNITGSSDSCGALLTSPQSLVNGMTTFQTTGSDTFFFSGQPSGSGGFTVTVTDESNPSLTATSAPVVVTGD